MKRIGVNVADVSEEGSDYNMAHKRAETESQFYVLLTVNPCRIL